MYVVLTNEIADVDSSEFEKIGRFDPRVVSMPCVDLSVGVKGMRTSLLHGVEDCQNMAFVSFEPDDLVCTEDAYFNDPFKPVLLYRRGSRKYVELRYSHKIGLLSLTVFFLVLVEDCQFGYEDNPDIDITELWDRALIKGI